MANSLRVLKGFLALLSFLTIIPTRVYDVLLAAKYFYLAPLVGLIEGAFTVLPLYLPVNVFLRSAITLALMYVITGFNHLDGFADFADVLGSRKRGDSALKILKEPWRGSTAIASTILIILLSYSAILALSSQVMLVILSHIVVAEIMYLLAVVSKKPNYSGLGYLFISEAKNKFNVIANITVFSSLIASIVFFTGLTSALYAVVSILLGVVVLVYTRRTAHSVLGYVNGDVLGFCFEFSRALILVGLAVASAVLAL